MFSYLTLALTSTLAYAAPVTNTTAEPTFSFVASPRGRGTLDILFTSIITLVLCVWTALHPNILPNPSLYNNLIYKAVYAMLGLVFPEVVLGIALNEFRKARDILEAAQAAVAPKAAPNNTAPIELAPRGAGTQEVGPQEINAQPVGAQLAQPEGIDVQEQHPLLTGSEGAGAEGLRPQEVESGKTGEVSLGITHKARRVLDLPRHLLESIRRFWEAVCKFLDLSDETEFGIGGAFFGVMGGYVFSLHGVSSLKCERTLSADGIMFLLQNNIITPSDLATFKKDIQDKGKADMVGKSLVCGQAMWMMMNCLFRKAAGLPITIIELNVIVHVVCAIIIYACWWTKPHNAGSAISLDRCIPKDIRLALYVIDHPLGVELHVSRSTSTQFEPLKFFFPNGSLQGSSGHAENASSSPDSVVSGANSQSCGDDRLDPSYDLANDHRIAAGAGRKGTGISIYQRGYYLSQQEEWEILNVTKRGGRVWPWQDGTPLQIFEGEVLVDYTKEISFQASKLINLTPQDYELLVAAADVLRSPDGKQLSSDASVTLLRPTTKFNMTSSPTVPDISGLQRMWIPLYLLYGSVHATLWNCYFPSELEKLLWRTSCILVMVPGLGAWAVRFGESLFGNRSLTIRPPQFGIRYASGTGYSVRGRAIILIPLTLLVTVAGAIFGAIVGYRYVSRSTMIPHFKSFLHMIILGSAIGVCLVGLWVYGELFCERTDSENPETLLFILKVLLYYPVKTFILSLTLLYILARLYIFVETFLCLRRLPGGAYETVVWEEFFPHL